MNLEGQISGQRGQIHSLRGQVSGLRGQIQGLRGQISSPRGQISGLRRQILGLRGQISGLRGSGGWTDRQTNESPLCSTGLCPLWGRCPASHSKLQPCEAGQRVSLTMYCPRATCLYLLALTCIKIFIAFEIRKISKMS